MDIRICNLSYTDLKLDENGKLTNMESNFLEPSPRIDYKSYREFIDKFVVSKKKEYAFYYKEEIDELDMEFNLAKTKIIDLLNTNNEVGIVSLKVAMPKRMKEIEVKLDSFDVDAFLSFSINTIYWISK